jgi:hypothetical protein
MRGPVSCPLAPSERKVERPTERSPRHCELAGGLVLICMREARGTSLTQVGASTQGANGLVQTLSNQICKVNRDEEVILGYEVTMEIRVWIPSLLG